MGKRHIATVGLLMLSAFLGGALMTWVLHDQPAYAQTSTMPQTAWEYQRVTHANYTSDTTHLNEELAKHTTKGWELIQVNEGAQYSNQIITYWKRAKRSQAY